MCIFCVAIATIFGIYLVMHWVLCNMIFCVSTSACEKARAPGPGAHRPRLRAHSPGRREARGAVVAKHAQRTGAPADRGTPPPHRPRAGAPPTKGSTQTTGKITDAKAILTSAVCLLSVCLSVCLSTLTKRRGRDGTRGLLAGTPGDGAATAPGARALRAARADLLGTVAACAWVSSHRVSLGATKDICHTVWLSMKGATIC